MSDPNFHLNPNAVQRGGPGTTRVSVEGPFGPADEHTDALLQLAASAHGKLSGAQARAAGRRADLDTPQELAELAAGARTLIEQLRVLEVAAGTAARTAGMDTPTLAAQVGISHRTVQERYRHLRLRPDPPGAGPRDLLRLDAEGRPLPLVLELAPATGQFCFTHVQTPIDATWTGKLWHWPVQLLTGPGATSLLQRLCPLAERILVGTDLVDGSRVPDADARAAAAEIARTCEHAVLYPALRQIEAADFFTGQDPTAVTTALGLPTGADHVQVAAAAQVARENALNYLVLLTGVEEYLRAAIAPAEVVGEPGEDGAK